MSTRPTWDEYFYSLATLVSTRATCPRMSVGAVVVKNKRVIGMGYNGAPDGEEHCLDSGCLIVYNHCKRSRHAEVNAIINTQGNIYGATIYCTHDPCNDCRRELDKVGITDIRFIQPKRLTDSIT